MPIRVGIDSHGAEADGEGNATYGRNLISALYAEEGDHSLALFAADPAHPFYRGLPPRPRSRAVGVSQGAGILRVALTLGRAAARERVERELSFEARTRRLESIYEELIQQRRSVRASGWSAHA